MTSCICYALGIIVMVETNSVSVLSLGYVSSEVFQIGSLLAALYACNSIDNIPHNYFIVKYGIIFMGFFSTYIYYYGVNQGVYVFMLGFKLVAVVIILYTIIVKWKFNIYIKVISILAFGSGGIYLSLYDFFIYGSSGYSRGILYVGIGIIFFFIQNLVFAVLYKIQAEAQQKLKGDYLVDFAENSADIIFYYNVVPYPRFSFVSPAAKTLLGYSPEDFYNNNKLHVEIALEEDRMLMEELLGGFDGDYKDCIVTVETKNGEIVNLQCLVSKQKSNGKVIAVEGVFRDITERLEAERKIKENNKNRQLMLSYISHDLKTPITYILGYSEAIEKGIINSEEEKQKAMKSIAARARSLTRLVDDISMLSKLEANKFNYEFEKISCLELAERLRASHAGDFLNQDGDYSFIDREYSFRINEGVGENDCVLADVSRIEQVFENIFSNALKATEDGGKIAVECGIDRMKSSFFISVADDGVGISKEDLAHIFENFYRSPQTKKRRGGSGLGLSLSYQIIKGHSGEIKVFSEMEAGSKFVFELPLFDENGEDKSSR